MSRAREIAVRLRRNRQSSSGDDLSASVAAGSGERTYTACAAPSIQMNFQPDGEVRACCHNMVHSLGSVTQQSLRDIWDGPVATDLRDRLAVDDYSLGCQGCEDQVALEGRPGSAPARFDPMATHLTADPAPHTWPRLMEFNLSNACNLQCVQCNGDLSSSIRSHREGRAPLPKVYDDRFFDELAEFLPHLDAVQFAGGEPFLAPENFRVWDLMAEVSPDLRCTVVTNATQWNRRVERVLEQLPIGFCFSIDGVVKDTYESIRVDADFDLVMANIDRFCDYANERGTPLAVNHCLMVQNYHEFGEMLLFADERRLPVNVCVVRQPGHCSISRLPIDELCDVLHTMEQQDAMVRPQLELNLAVWDRELGRIRDWAESGAAADGLDSQWAASAFKILTFRRAGAGAHDDRAAKADLAGFAEDGVVYEIGVGPDDRILRISPDLIDLLGNAAHALVGAPSEMLQGVSTARFGTMLNYEVLAEQEDRVDARVTYRQAEFRLTMVPIRAENGWADEARILIAARPST